MGEDQLPQDQVPAAQVPESPKEQENQIDYKGFFDTQLEKEATRKSQLEEKLATKLTDVQKLQVEREIFEIEKNLAKMNYKPESTDSIVETIVKSGIEVNSPTYNFLKETTKNLSPSDASAFVDFATQLIGTLNDKRPVSLNDSPAGDGRGQPSNVGFSTKDIIGNNSSAAKQNLMDILGHVASKGI